MKKIQNATITNLVFSGGGAKGGIYPGVYSALVEADAIKSVTAVAGSSAGAIISGLIATGIKPDKLTSILKSSRLDALLGKGIIHKNANPLYDLLNKTIKENIADFLQTNNFEATRSTRLEQLKVEIFDSTAWLEHVNNKLSGIQTEEQDAKLNQEKIDIENKLLHLKRQQEELITINAQSIDDIASRAKSTDGKILFRDNQLLQLLAPETFKNLIVTAVQKDNGCLSIFSADTTPDVEIALACKASSALPILLAPVAINGINYIDGGYRDNVPTNYFALNQSTFDNPPQVDLQQVIDRNKKAKTLVFAFGDEKSDNHYAIYSNKANLYNPKALIKFIVDVVLKFILKIKSEHKFSHDEEATLQNLRKHALDVVLLDTKDVGTISFKSAQEQAEYLAIKGNVSTLNFLENNDIEIPTNKNLLYQNFFLNVYEELQSEKSSWLKKVSHKPEFKKQLLNFCSTAQTKDFESNRDEILASYVQIASKDKVNFNVDSAGMKAIIKSLNNSTIPIEIKQTFANILKVNLSGEQIRNFKFTKEHFQSAAKDLNNLASSVKKLNSAPGFSITG
jgi:NTE family protein